MRAQPTASHFVAGAYRDDPAGRRFESRYPATGEVIAELNAATEATVEAAVAAAREAQKAWGALPGRERGRVLRRAADILRAKNREISVLETLDTGKALQETLVADAASGADCLEYFGGLAASVEGITADVGGSFVYTRREPLGVVAAIGAWNYPIQIACWKAAPALAAGNAVIFKPAETTPLSALKLAEALKEAGLPDGVYNVVQGFAETGRMLVRHPGIAKVSLTGETGTGRRVMADAAETLKQVTLELGGKSPLIVFEDADLDNAVGAAMLANFYSTGQICSNGTRVFVQRSVKDAFLDKLVARTERIVLGDPLDEATHLGPLVSHEHREKVLSYLAIGREEGARLLIGGGVPRVQGFEGGAWVEPTVFADVTDGMRIAREEIFGPVMAVLDFADEAEVVTRANDTPYGLAAGVFTRDIARAHRVIAALDAGTTWINTYNLTPVEMPFGGVKQSGLGRENGRAALDSYTRVKSVYVETGDVAAPY
ncbi:betaine-aldehyde dehydrogenase [Oharaeibacter diazotrophicus]|uniref:Betaine aldehyde dehydrogenase n=1 Tax=Oharaeibacter diazotrophicus TaxID=1920512 RepID=A0A4R6R9N1_9HYPH|nr:betaine-aldehyde dehydrogenase [Oharaeibacter diazotrophicus]TDP82565.1 betaine aldehyde dehydrogenase [Oharaeibacter diazotrophicus]BBE72671.1 NAD/NADP-dependent betaine aldehyde dehydrogenase [Pleomorphomonas sp. SM30]GLS76705.1 NAD/NADP-dependent betaine aldehyde dehydrogenase [Oharaeibacter diazotrophicus]